MRAYEILEPAKRTTSVVFASPHSGRNYPWTFKRRSVLNELALRSSEDAFVDLLFDSAPKCGAVFLTATAPRAYLDLNRAEEELDPALIEGASRNIINPRIASGLGVIPRVVANSRAIYRGKLSMSEVKDRIETIWRPYHAALEGVLQDNLRQFGKAILIDCHSMPHEAISMRNKSVRYTPEVVLGDRYGAAAGEELMDRVEQIFQHAGLQVARNTPFAGAYVSQHYGRPHKRQHAIQIEIDRALYLNEEKIEPNENFGDFRQLMRRVTEEIAEMGRGASVPLAAE